MKSQYWRKLKKQKLRQPTDSVLATIEYVMFSGNTDSHGPKAQLDQNEEGLSLSQGKV